MESNLQERLFSLQEKDYRDFQAKLIPNIRKETIIGVRVPKLRKLAKDFGKAPEKDDFLEALPHEYYEENLLQAILLSSIKDYDEALKKIESFLPYIDNRAVCDTLTPLAFKKNLGDLEGEIERWIASDHPYTVRFGIEMLMKFYLDDNFKEKYPDLVASVHNEDYYVKMMVARYFATALAKQGEKILPFLKEQRLDPRCHNKTIQKACESFRIPDEEKAYLKTLKIK